MKNDNPIKVLEIQPTLDRSKRIPFIRQAMGHPKRASQTDVITCKAAREILHHLRGDLKRERGGFLLGRRFQHGNRSWLRIENSLPLNDNWGSPTSFQFPLQAWTTLEQECDAGTYVGVGWYHSHPGMGIFYSQRDCGVHSRFLSESTLGLVVDPVRNEWGSFRIWEGRPISQKGMWIANSFASRKWPKWFPYPKGQAS